MVLRKGSITLVVSEKEVTFTHLINNLTNSIKFLSLVSALSVSIMRVDITIKMHEYSLKKRHCPLKSTQSSALSGHTYNSETSLQFYRTSNIIAPIWEDPVYP